MTKSQNYQPKQQENVIAAFIQRAAVKLDISTQFLRSESEKRFE